MAAGVKLTNHELTVLVTGGDGDGFGIGGNHFVHSTRRNVDLLYIVMDNQNHWKELVSESIYGLTTADFSHQPHRYEDEAQAALTLWADKFPWLLSGNDLRGFLGGCHPGDVAREDESAKTE